MSFVDRARSSFERGDTVRAVLGLVAGLRRHPHDDDGYDLLTEIVRDHVDSSGMEHEIADVVARHPERDELLSEMIIGLREREQDRVADRLLSEGSRRGIEYIPPPEPEPEPKPEPEEPEPEPDAESEVTVESTEVDVAESDEVSAADEASVDSADEDDAPEESPEERPDKNTPVVPDEPEIVDDDTAAERRRVAVEARRRETRRKRRRRTLIVFVAALLVGLAVVGAYAFSTMNRSAKLSEIDEQLQTFDAFAEEPVKIAEETATGFGAADFKERLWFARALALDAGQPVAAEIPTSDFDTVWGWSAAALQSLASDDIEATITLVTRAERQHGESLPSIWARARLEEERGEYEKAQNGAQRILDRYPEFRPAHEMLVRIAARMLDFAEMEAALGELSALSPHHPYATLADLPHPETVLIGGTSEVELPAEEVQGGAFLSAVGSYKEAVIASLEGRHEEALEAARTAADADPRFAPAHLLLGATLAAEGNAEKSAAAFRKVAEVPDASERLRAVLATVAPISLAGSGRPDLAAPFTTPFDRLRDAELSDDFDATWREKRPVALRRSVLGSGRRSTWDVRALFARVEVLRQFGRYRLAAATLQELHARGIAPARARAMVTGLSLETGAELGWSPEIAPENAPPIVGMTRDLHAGRYDEVADVEHEELPGWALPEALRMRVEGMLGLRRLGQALQTLENAELGVAHRPMLQGLRLRALARLGRQNRDYVALHDALAKPEPTGITRMLDLAEAAFWQGSLREARNWLDAVEDRAPEHRRAAWICGLVNRARNNLEDAAECFAKSGRNYDDTAGLLIEIGYLQMQLENWDEARKMFHKALLQKRSDLEAARGMGNAYTRLDSSVAARDLERILQGYSKSSENAAVRGELLKWLSVVRGVRDGDEDAKVILEQSADLVGERDDILMERARFHRAREEWDDARTLYESALKQNATLADAHLAIARIDLRREKARSAKRHLERYLALEPRGRSASWARRTLKRIK